MSSSTLSGVECCGISSFSGADCGAGGTGPRGVEPGPEDFPGGLDGARRASGIWVIAGLAGAANGPPAPANSATPKAEPKPGLKPGPKGSRRRRNDSPPGGKSASWRGGRVLRRVLQRIVDSNFTSGFGLPCGTPSRNGCRGAGGWPHCPAGVTLTHAAPAAESCRRVNPTESGGAAGQIQIGRLTQR